ncbi:MAG: glycosyltransferase [Acidobacteriota bacterium]
MAKIIVSGPIANKPFNGGVAWIPLTYILGLRRLGFDVYFIEQIAADTCVDAQGARTPFNDSINRAYFEDTVERFGLFGSAALVLEDCSQVYGATYDEVLSWTAKADLLINISGHLKVEPLTSSIHCKAYIDEDPGFTQFWHAAGNSGLDLEGHEYHFTMGGRLGSADCSIPRNGIDWRPMLPPVVLDQWPISSAKNGREFTTVASWRGPFGVVQFGDKTFGLKVHEFRKFIELPQRSSQKFEIALNIHPADEKDMQSLRHNGWQLVDPKEAAGDPLAFQRYVQKSSAEFSVAQGIYVDTNSGWFSDRTVRYLASGKPALVQETGFSRNLPVGEGLIFFRALDEAIAGAESIALDYDRHSRAARALAEEYFASDKVLGRLIEEIGIAP